MKIVLMGFATVIGMLLASGNAQAADVANGKKIFDRWCWGCHAPMDARVGYDPPAGTIRLQDRYKGALPAALEARTDLSTALIKTNVRNGINMMPQTRKTEVSDSELDDLAAYLTRNNK